MYTENPFTPNFGQVPSRIAGRDALIQEMVQAFDEGQNDPNLSSIFVGARGTGKTALLTYLASEAEQHGWISVNVTCLPGMLEDAAEQAARKTADLVAPDAGRHLTGVTLGQFLGLEWENDATTPLNWRSRMGLLIEQLAKTQTGLLITVDEINPSLDEMILLAATYQHFVRENKKVALLMAGLPFKVSALLASDSASFLRRASNHQLGLVADHDVALALRATVELAGRSIEDDALDLATQAVCGFPYMLQLVGYRAWQSSDSDALDLRSVRAGIALASEDMKSRVLKATLDELSEKDIEFLEAMLQDLQSSTSKDLAARLGKSSGHISTYKRRLLEQGVIENAGRGAVRFALPLLREYLPEYLEKFF